MSCCWPSEERSDRTSSHNWSWLFQPITSWSNVSKGHATSQALGVLQHVRHCQCARKGTGYREDQKKYTRREIPALFMLLDTIPQCLVAVLLGSTDSVCSPSWGGGFNPWTRKLMDPRRCWTKRRRAATTKTNRLERSHSLPSASEGIC